MSDFIEAILGLVFDLLEAVLELWLGQYSWPETTRGRISLVVLLLVLGIMIWWELK
jgi:hypothetical protein